MSVGLLFDATQCIGCGACSAACKEQNDLPLPIEPETTAYTWTTVQQRDGVNVRRLCMHCLEPTCVSVCPVGALSKTPEGPVVYDSKKCIGCRYCIMACPFGVPKYQWDRVIPVVGKCILCSGRVKSGLPTACAAVCPTGATLFGERDTLIREARSRIAERPERYVDHVYGLEEAGGTSVLMLSGVAFERLGMKTDLPRQPLPMLTWQVMSKIPDFVLLAGAFLFGIHWITRRRDEVQRSESGPLSRVAEARRPGVVRELWRRFKQRGRRA
jgi:formate dehydrogenase iron-sulfur subunit